MPSLRLVYVSVMHFARARSWLPDWSSAYKITEEAPLMNTSACLFSCSKSASIEGSSDGAAEEEEEDDDDGTALFTLLLPPLLSAAPASCGTELEEEEEEVVVSSPSLSLSRISNNGSSSGWLRRVWASRKRAMYRVERLLISKKESLRKYAHMTGRRHEVSSRPAKVASTWKGREAEGRLLVSDVSDDATCSSSCFCRSSLAWLLNRFTASS
mmetsp:Transcript_26468/g.43332  ORF Transcript_26468/g.43332 Transcript_26468/m.43332 type:complete len:213 (-) Transcript_26468:348-986(-)